MYVVYIKRVDDIFLCGTHAQCMQWLTTTLLILILTKFSYTPAIGEPQQLYRTWLSLSDYLIQLHACMCSGDHACMSVCNLG